MISYEYDMVSLSPQLLRVCKGLALLAAMVLAFIPALPAQAHLHAPGELMSVSHSHVIDQRMAGEDNDRAPDQAADACGCCLVSHLPVMPASSSVPVQVCTPRGHYALDAILGLEDAIGERLPDPPKAST